MNRWVLDIASGVLAVLFIYGVCAVAGVEFDIWIASCGAFAGMWYRARREQ
jgi:hypothetical protein